MLGERAWQVWSCDAHLLVTDPEALSGASAVVDQHLASIGDACDRFRDDSELRRIASGVPTPVTALLAQLVRTALDSAAATDGLCDPTVGRLVADAGYDRDIRLVLDDDRPVRVLVRPKRTWESVRLEHDVLTVPEGVELDLGATAKAFAADRAAAAIRRGFGCGVLVNIGGDLATAGAGPEGGWQVRVQDLPDEPETQVAVADGYALATSSTIRRTWRRGTDRMHHIIDPRSGTPAAPVWRTVSVVAPTAVEANAATTAAIVAGTAAVERLDRAGLPARLVAADRSVMTIGGWPAEPGTAA